MTKKLPKIKKTDISDEAARAELERIAKSIRAPLLEIQSIENMIGAALEQIQPDIKLAALMQRQLQTEIQPILEAYKQSMDITNLVKSVLQFPKD